MESERAFHLMSRIQNKLTNRLDKNLGTRLRITMHLPKDPAKVNWEEAYEIFEAQRKRYDIDLSKGNKNFPRSQEAARNMLTNFYLSNCTF